MSNSTNDTKKGLGFLQVLTLIFITLKLTGNIDWSWWYVLLPIIIPIAIMIVVLCVVLVRSCSN